jgi:hypothetical protein
MSEETVKGPHLVNHHFIEGDIVVAVCAVCNSVIGFASCIDELSGTELKHACEATKAKRTAA